MLILWWCLVGAVRRFLEKAMAVYVKMGDERGLAEAYRISAGIFAGETKLPWATRTTFTSDPSHSRHIRVRGGRGADTHHQDKAKAIDYLQRSLALVDKIFGRESVQAADIMQKFGCDPYIPSS